MKLILIGSGKIASDSHIPAILKNKDIDLVGIYDKSKSNALKVIKKYNLKRQIIKNSLDEMFGMDSDVVDICTPPNTHKNLILSAIKSDKHVIVEKPFVINTPEAMEIEKVLSKKNHLKFSVIREFRYSDPIQRLIHNLNKGKLGKFISMRSIYRSTLPLGYSESDWRFDNPRLGRGVLEDIGVHALDLLMFFGGEVEEVRIFGGDILGTMGFDTQVSCLLKFENKCIGYLDISWLCMNTTQLFEINGSGGTGTADITNNQFSYIGRKKFPISLFRVMKMDLKTIQEILTRKYFKKYQFMFEKNFQDIIDSIKYDKKPPSDFEYSKCLLYIREEISKQLESFKGSYNLEE